MNCTGIESTKPDIEIRHQLQHSHKGLKIASHNVNGIRDHHYELRYLVTNIGFHILTLNETKVDKDVP